MSQSKPGCPTCGRDIKPQWNYCPQCGRKLSAITFPSLVGGSKPGLK